MNQSKINALFVSLTAKSCPTPPGWKDDNSGVRSQQVFRVGQSVRVTCPKGQQVKGSGTITCRPDQTWTPISSVCESRYKKINLSHLGINCKLHEQLKYVLSKQEAKQD